MPKLIIPRGRQKKNFQNKPLYGGTLGGDSRGPIYYIKLALALGCGFIVLGGLYLFALQSIYGLVIAISVVLALAWLLLQQR